MSERIVILGAGIAGVSACEEILKTAPEAEITLIHNERDLPYLRPLLSKLSLTTFRRDSLSLHTAEWYSEHGVRLLGSTVVDRILPEQKEVRLEDGTLLPYDKCIYALGARCHIPPVPGADLPGTACVRSIQDLQKIRRLLAPAKRAVVIGGGVIGLEFAWEIKKAGCDVTVLEALPHLMERVLDPESACVLEERCAACGVDVYTGVSVERIAGSDRAEAVILADGRSFPADLVLLSCGIRANTAVAERSGIPCGRGVLVNDRLQTCLPDVYAAGDCTQIDESESHSAMGLCRTDNLNPGLWTYAMESGRIAGFNAVHPENEAQRFAPKHDAVLLSAMGTSLVSVGEVRAENCDRAECRKRQDNSPDGQFLINPHAGAGFHFEKRFYRGDTLCGAVLMGDLSSLPDILSEVSTANEVGGFPAPTEEKP